MCIRDSDKKVTVQPDTIDDYNEVLAGLEKEYNLITLAPSIQRITINKRPLIQIYVPGDSIVSCFLGGTNSVSYTHLDVYKRQTYYPTIWNVCPATEFPRRYKRLPK